MAPLSFINEEGKADGILADLWKEWAKYSGKNIIFELSDWKQALDSTINGKAQINAGLFYSDQRAGKLSYGDTLFSMKGALFAANEIVIENSVNMQDTICGVLKGGYDKTFMTKHYPYTPLMLFNSIEDLFKTVSAGRIKLFVADYPVAIYQLNEYGLEESFTNLKTLYTRELYPAVSKKNHELIQLINENMAAIPKQQKQRILRKWLNHEDKVATSKYIGVISIIVILGLFLMHLPEVKRFIRFIK